MAPAMAQGAIPLHENPRTGQPPKSAVRDTSKESTPQGTKKLDAQNSFGRKQIQETTNKKAPVRSGVHSGQTLKQLEWRSVSILLPHQISQTAQEPSKSQAQTL